MKNNNNNIYFIADTHFGHKKIIEYENRPFKDVEEMDEAIISNWNSVVKKKDRIFILGDFSFYDNIKTKEICERLNGYKTLILGNHDSKSVQAYMDMGFNNVSKYPIIVDEFWILSHEPFYINEQVPYGNIFGHVHSNLTYRDYSKQTFCVSVERINYTPIRFSDIKNKMGIY